VEVCKPVRQEYEWRIDDVRRLTECKMIRISYRDTDTDTDTSKIRIQNVLLQ
jgi:hypothetical protein